MQPGTSESLSVNIEVMFQTMYSLFRKNSAPSQWKQTGTHPWIVRIMLMILETFYMTIAKNHTMFSGYGASHVNIFLTEDWMVLPFIELPTVLPKGFDIIRSESASHRSLKLA